MLFSDTLLHDIMCYSIYEIDKKSLIVWKIKIN